MTQYKNSLVPIENIGNERYKEMVSLENRHTVSSIQQALDARPNSDICLSLNPIEKTYVQEVLEDCQISEVYKVVSRQKFLNIIDQTKAKLINIFMDFNETVFENGLEFKSNEKQEAIQSIVNYYFNAANINMGSGSIDAKESNNIGGQDNTVTISAEIKHRLSDIVNQIESISQEIYEDRTDIAEAILEIRTELNSKISKPKALKSLFYAIKGIVGISSICDLVQKAIDLLT